MAQTTTERGNERRGRNGQKRRYSAKRISRSIVDRRGQVSLVAIAILLFVIAINTIMMPTPFRSSTRTVFVRAFRSLSTTTRVSSRAMVGIHRHLEVGGGGGGVCQQSIHILDNPSWSTTRRSRFSSVLFLAGKNNNGGGGLTRQYSLVVHGPPGMDVTKPIPKQKQQNRRPFKLVIVESPSKCKTIANILQSYVEEHNLGYDFVVTSSMGHIRNIPKSKSSKDQTIAGIDIVPLLPQGPGDATATATTSQHDYIPHYEIIPGKERLIENMKEWYNASQQLILATDDDREGEAMAWHLLQVLLEDESSSSSSHDPPVRVRFTEITSKAITQAMEHAEPNLRNNLVQAQETRRILDRLAGFTVSPVLWKKIAPGLSAGRVQSVGMALIVQRERERLAFRESQYWSLKASFSAPPQAGEESVRFEGQLISVNGQTLASGTTDFDPRQSNQLTDASSNKLHLQEVLASNIVESIGSESEGWEWTIQNITTSQRKLNPPLPFVTSTLQQEGNRRLGLSVSATMQLAQQLYEKGFISYMRTDSNHLSGDAHAAIQAEIENEFGGPDKYIHRSNVVGGGKRKKKSNKPDPQAAHEAIRPAVQSNGRFTKPLDLPSTFDQAAQEVYRLVYQRTVASQMPPQVSNQKSITILGSDDDETEVLFRTSGSVVVDPGYTVIYPKQSESASPILPSNLVEGQRLDCEGADSRMHQTQPPARYTEASFVQELEALGVGRPSTYAGTVQILRDRAYVGSPVQNDSERGRANQKKVSGPAISAQRAAGGAEFTGAKNARGPMVPSLTAFVVTSLLEKHCNMYVDPAFTAQMEERLDKIAHTEVEGSQDERLSYLDEFYQGENGLAAQIHRISENVDSDDARRLNLPSLDSNENEEGVEVGLFVGPWGPFVKKIAVATDGEEVTKSLSASLPPSMATDLSTLTQKTLNAVLKSKEENGSILGEHPDDGRTLKLKIGPYGGYLQWGEDGEESTTTHTLPSHLRSIKNMDIIDVAGDGDRALPEMLGISLEMAVQYVNLPRTVCMMNGLPVVASIGPYGPYLKYNNTFVSLSAKDGDVLTIDGATAEELVTEDLSRKSTSGAGVLAELGEKEEHSVCVKRGRFGSYINWKKVNARLPPEYRDDPSELPLEEAWSLIQSKASKPTKTKGQGKKEASNGPPPPKRPPSAYLLFSSAKRHDVAKEFRSLGDVSKELARLWKGASEDEKQPFVEKAMVAKSAYEEEKKRWAQKTTGKKAGSRIGSGGSENANTPKRPRSAYIFFCNHNRASVSQEHKTLGEVSKELARRWATLDDQSKEKFALMAAQDRERYEREKNGVMDPTEAVNGVFSEESVPRAFTTVKMDEKKPKRAKSAYMLFCASLRSDVSIDEEGNKRSLGDTTKRLAELWRECDDTTRATFVERAEQEKAAMQV